jgi:hypothetical protein
LNDKRYIRYNDSSRGMVSVAKWLRRQVVALEIEGSNPSVHPISKLRRDREHSSRNYCDCSLTDADVAVWSCHEFLYLY